MRLAATTDSGSLRAVFDTRAGIALLSACLFIFAEIPGRHLAVAPLSQESMCVRTRLCASKKGVNEILSECVHVCRSWHAYMHISDQILSSAGVGGAAHRAPPSCAAL